MSMFSQEEETDDLWAGGPFRDHWGLEPEGIRGNYAWRAPMGRPPKPSPLDRYVKQLGTVLAQTMLDQALLILRDEESK